MIVGEAPGAEEARQGRPFVGPSGELLNEALHAAKIDRAEVFVTNVYGYRPPDNRTPTDAELSQYYDEYFKEEFDAVDPVVVLLLGNTAGREFYGESWRGITRERGKISGTVDRDRPKRITVPAFHPSYVLRGSGRKEFFRDVALFADILNEVSP